MNYNSTKRNEVTDLVNGFVVCNYKHLHLLAVPGAGFSNNTVMTVFGEDLTPTFLWLSIC